jgi:hypothetical protein
MLDQDGFRLLSFTGAGDQGLLQVGSADSLKPILSRPGEVAGIPPAVLGAGLA